MFDKEENYFPGGENLGPDPNGPSYGGMGNDNGTSAPNYGAALDSGKELLQKFAPLLVAVVIILVIIGAVTWWLGQNQTVTLSVTGLDSPSISTAKVTVLGSDNKSVYVGSGDTHTVTLQPGNYTVRATADGYKSQTMSLKIPNEKNGERVNLVPIALEKNISATIEMQFDASTIYPKEVQTGTLVITNTGDQILQDVPVIVKNSGGLTVTVTPDTFSVSAGGATSLSFTVEQKTAVTKQVDASPIIAIQDTKITAPFKITLMPAVQNKDVIYSGDIRSEAIQKTSLTAGAPVKITITIQNKNKTLPLTDVSLKILPLDSTYADKIDWIQFDQYTGDKQSATIDSIDPASTKPIGLTIQPAVNATIDDGTFRGLLSISSLSLESDKNFTIYLVVTKENKVGLTLTPQALTMTCTTSLGTCNPVSQTQIGTLKNSGTVKVEGIANIMVDPTSAPQCAWLDISPTTIASLAPSDPAVKIFAAVNPSYTDEAQFICYLKWQYTDPLGSGTNVTETSAPVTIKVTQKAS